MTEKISRDEITSESHYLSRRHFNKDSARLSAGSLFLGACGKKPASIPGGVETTPLGTAASFGLSSQRISHLALRPCLQGRYAHPVDLWHTFLC